jgi:hypothetical protein
MSGIRAADLQAGDAGIGATPSVVSEWRHLPQGMGDTIG